MNPPLKQDETATNISTRYDLEHGNSPEPYKSEELINMVIEIKELEQKALKDDRDAANNRNKIYEMIHSGASSDEVLAKTLEFLGIDPSIRTFLKNDVVLMYLSQRAYSNSRIHHHIIT